MKQRQTAVAAISALGAVMPLYILGSYYSVGVQNAIRKWSGIQPLLKAHPRWGAVYDTAEATALASLAILMASAMFLFLAKRFGVRRLFRGFLAALPVIVAGSAIGRYLLNPAQPMPGLIAVLVTIFLAVSVSMLVGYREKCAGD